MDRDLQKLMGQLKSLQETDTIGDAVAASWHVFKISGIPSCAQHRLGHGHVLFISFSLRRGYHDP